MSRLRNGLAIVLALLVFLLAAGPASAARLRFHYVPAANGCPMTLAPLRPGVTGERIGVFSREAYSLPPPKTTFTAALRHTITGAIVQVPLGLPVDSTPTIEHRTNRVIYNYGSYTVEVTFLADGSVDVIYNSGLMRDI